MNTPKAIKMNSRLGKAMMHADAQQTNRPDGSASGVDFPSADGGAGASGTVREILADAVGEVDPAVAQSFITTRRWRSDYADLMVELTRTSSRSAEASVAIARAGLSSMGKRMQFSRDGEAVPLSGALAAFQPRPGFGAEHISGRAAPVDELLVPYRGEVLRGDELRAQLQRWVAGGIVEPSFATAIETVMAHPEWLALPGHSVAVIGAGAEMGPLAPLTQWGAHVLAIDVPATAVWSNIVATAQAGAGRVTMPCRPDGGHGIDVVTELPELRQWMDQCAGEDSLVVGMYAYADRALHIRVSAAVDAAAEDLLLARPDTALAYLATPTDVYAVTDSVVDYARDAYRQRQWASVGRALSAGRGFTPAYRGRPAPGTRHVADSLVTQQGPNYAAAKRCQRWRGVAAAADGRRISFNIAPMSWTRSVTRNRILEAAYFGACHFGVEIFDADTARVLMAALLVHDLNQPTPGAARHPEELFSDQAAHNGLWRVGYEPRSVLPVAALLGLPNTLWRRG
jgi:hypothetical protein